MTHHKYQRGLLVVLLLATAAGRLYGQDASAKKGRIIFEKEDAGAFQDVSQTDKQQWRAGLGKISKAVLQTPALQAPLGYNVRVSYLATATPTPNLPWLKASRASVFFQLNPLYYDQGKLLDEPEGGSEVMRKALQDAQAAYGRELKNLQGIERQIDDDSGKTSLTALEKMMFTTDTASRKNIQLLLDADARLVAALGKRLNDHQHKLSVVEAGKPAFVDWTATGEADLREAGDLTCPDLAAGDDPHRSELWTVNPAYFNNHLAASAVQLIAVTYYYHPQLTVERLKAEAAKLFKTIDYNRLCALITR